MATFRNVGGLTQTFDVWYEIWKDGSEVYNNQQTVTSLDPGTTVQVSFAESLRKNRKRFNPERPDSILEHAVDEKKLEGYRSEPKTWN